MERKDQDHFMPADVGRSTYGAMNAANVFVWNENALETEDWYTQDMKVWDKSVSAGISQWNKYVNNRESLMLSIQGQVEPSLWDKTKADTRFAAIQASKCPIDLINLLKEKCTGGSAGVWPPLAYLRQLNKTISFSQSPPQGGTPMPNGEYKCTVKSYTTTTMKLGGLLAFRSTLMESILATSQPVVTLQGYVGMNEAARRPYDLLYANKIVLVIMTDGCSFGSLKKWLAQNQLIPGQPAYTSSSNELINMMNSRSFSIDANK